MVDFIWVWIVSALLLVMVLGFIGVLAYPKQFEQFCNETPLVFPNGCFVQAAVVFGVIGFFAIFLWK